MVKKKTALYILILFLTTTLLSFPGNAIDTSPKKEVQDLVDAWVAMWNSYDLTKVNRLFLQDSRVSYFSSEKEGLIQGPEAVLEHHEGFGFVEGGKSKENKLWVGEVQISGFGTAAIVAGIWYFQRASAEEDSVQKGPFTFVCVKQGKNWRLAHLNFSTYKED
jgi:ketosteroid isomerase-like protein